VTLAISRTIKKNLLYITFAAGAATIGASLINDSTPQAAAGIALILLGNTARALRVIERAIRDTAHERGSLQREQQAARELHEKWMVARAFLDKEAEHLCAQMAKVEQDAADRIASELDRLNAEMEASREDLMAEVEDRETELKRDGWFKGYDAGRRGILLDTPMSAGAQQSFRCLCLA
jgi:hypothetical protein